MGRYMIIGTATKIYVEKNSRYDTYNVEQIKEILSNKLNLNLYDITEDEENVYLSIKPKIFSENIISLLQNEYEILGIDINKDGNKELFEKIKATPYNEILDTIENKEMHGYNFQFLEGSNYIGNDISYISKDSKLEIYADITAFFLSDKVILETYYDLFDYLRYKIVKATDNPLKDDIFITVWG